MCIFSNLTENYLIHSLIRCSLSKDYDISEVLQKQALRQIGAEGCKQISKSVPIKLTVLEKKLALEL